MQNQHVAPVGRYGTAEDLDNPFRVDERHRVDRRRRPRLPDMYTSPRLKGCTHVGSRLSSGEREEPRKHLRGEDG